MTLLLTIEITVLAHHEAAWGGRPVTWGESHTDGLELLGWFGCGICSNGDAAREDFEPAAEG
jgi:hypothetical protein